MVTNQIDFNLKYFNKNRLFFQSIKDNVLPGIIMMTAAKIRQRNKFAYFVKFQLVQ